MTRFHFEYPVLGDEESEQKVQAAGSLFLVIFNHKLALFCKIIFIIRSTDERITENILKAMQTLASLAGHLELQTPRDAFITAICKASLPPNYTLTILSTFVSALGKNFIKRAVNIGESVNINIHILLSANR